MHSQVKSVSNSFCHWSIQQQTGDGKSKGDSFTKDPVKFLPLGTKKDDSFFKNILILLTNYILVVFFEIFYKVLIEEK